ncbi:MAG TPA: hypothetical protein DG753_13330 [Clostridium sp.]|nr:hypothetical protein [Clostridium sp.]
MKMKKNLAIIMTATMSLLTFTGCGQTTNNYMKEVTKTLEWEACSSESKGTLNLESKEAAQKVSISFASTAYKSGDKSYSEIKFTDPSGVFNIPEIKAYADGATAYINKSYYEGIYTMMGQAVPEGLKNINAEYIAIDSGMKNMELNKMMTDPNEIIKLSESIFGDSDIDLPYTQNGREYTMDLDSDQVVDLGVKGIKALSKNLDNVNNTFALGLNAEQIAEFKNQIVSEGFTQGITSIKDAIKGSTISSKEVFEDDKYTSNSNVNIEIKDLGKVSLVVNATSTKAEDKEISLPTSVAKFTPEQYAQLVGSEQQVSVSDAALAKIVGVEK